MKKPAKEKSDKKKRRNRLGDKDTKKIDDEELRFSFRFLELDDPVFSFDDCNPRYFYKLLERKKWLSTIKVVDFRNNRTSSLRSHEIEFTSPAVCRSGFPNNIQNLGKPWQFEVSSNKHGRVHGVLAGSTFYVVWLDPEHQLYSRR